MKKEEKTLHDHFVVIENLLLIGFLIMLSAVLFQDSTFVWILWVLGFLIASSSILYANKYYRCPHCKTKLDARRKVPNFCPNCGKELS